MPYFTIDVPCPSCGYNLRGLSLGRGCPECGLKVMTNELTTEERTDAKRLEAEVEANLREMQEEKARRQEIAALLTLWEKRGEHFDRLLDRIEEILDRYGTPP